MKTIKTLGMCAMVVLILVSSIFVSESAAPKKEVSDPGDGFAVLELFTSEGCSSCPPADELLAKIQETGDKRVYILAYHVDYWNRLGWRDVFSHALYTKRQYDYSGKFAGQVYTPQLVVNGKAEFVGSNSTAINNAVASAVTQPSPASLNIEAQLQAGDIQLKYQAIGAAANAQLNIAFVQKNAVTQVKRGENTGRTLKHVQVVRQLETFNLSNQNTLSIYPPDNFNLAQWEIIGFLQDPETHVILAATRAAFPTPETR